MQSATGYAIIASSKTITGRSFYKRYTCYAHLRRKAALLTGAASVATHRHSPCGNRRAEPCQRPSRCQYQAHPSVSTVPKPIKELEKVAEGEITPARPNVSLWPLQSVTCPITMCPSTVGWQRTASITFLLVLLPGISACKALSTIATPRIIPSAALART